MKLLRIATALAAALTPALPAVAANLPDADPAVWVVKDKDTTIYLFGTFHVLDGKADWFNDEVKTAFDRSDEVVLEALMPEDPASLAPIIAKYAAATNGKTLSEQLSPKGKEKLTAVLSKAGLPVAAIDKMSPAFASMTLALLPYQAAGMSPDKGTEAVLTKAAKASGKPLGELEGMENQLKMLGLMSPEEQVKAIEEMLAKYEELPAMIDRMKTYWNSGNADGFAKLMTEMQASSPDMYKVLMTDRNAKWAEWIDQRLDKPGTVFLAVGTAHLAGKDSVQDMLSKQGIVASRVKAD